LKTSLLLLSLPCCLNAAPDQCLQRSSLIGLTQQHSTEEQQYSDLAFLQILQESDRNTHLHYLTVCSDSDAFDEKHHITSV